MSYTIMNNIDYYDNNKVSGNPLIVKGYGSGSGSYKVGIYIRLSREDEEKERYQESESVQNQRTLLMQYVKENKLNFISEYVDDGVSGTSFDRPAFNNMIADIEARKNKYGCNERPIKIRKKLCTVRIVYRNIFSRA